MPPQLQRHNHNQHQRSSFLRKHPGLRCRRRCNCRSRSRVVPFLLLLPLTGVLVVDHAWFEFVFVSSFPSATNRSWQQRVPVPVGFRSSSFSSSSIASLTGRAFETVSEEVDASSVPPPPAIDSKSSLNFKSKSKPPAPTDWVIVEEYPKISPEGIDPFRILDTLRDRNRSGSGSPNRDTDNDDTKQHNNNDHVNDHVNDDRTDKYLSALERLGVTSTNLTLPIALMGLDPDRYPSLSNARKACRQGKIALLRCGSGSTSDSSEDGVFHRGAVGDRVHPLDSIARRELYKTILEEQQRSAPSSSSEYNYNYKYDTLGDGFVKSKFQRLPVAYEDDCMAIVVKPPGLLVHPQGKNGSWGRKNNVINALPYFLRKPKPPIPVVVVREDQDDEFQNKNDDDDDDDRTVLQKPVTVHRLDFATSGLLVAAKIKGAARLLAQEFEYRTARKTYTAMVYGIPSVARGRGRNDALSELPSFFGPDDEDDNHETDPSVVGGPSDNDKTPMLMEEDSHSADDKNIDNEWKVADCFLDGKRATTLWRILGSHNCTVPIRYNSTQQNDNDNDNESSSDVNVDVATVATATIPLSMVELKPRTGRYHQLRRTLAWLYGTPIVGDPVYATNGFVEDTYLPPSAKLVEGKQLRDYRSCLMLCSNEIDVAHPVFNTEAGKQEWKKQQQLQPNDDRAAQNKTIDDTAESEGESSVYETEDGVVRVHASIPLPKKFTKFLGMMERQKQKQNRDAASNT
eukprot:jgi/Psemu1/40269/gm1.40269_g